MRMRSEKCETILLANIDAEVKEEEETSVFRVDLPRAYNIQQIRVPRTNNIVHSSLPKIDNPSSESKPQLEVFALDSESRKFRLLLSDSLRADKSTQDVVVPVEPEVESQTLLVRVSQARSKVLIYGRPSPSTGIRPETGPVTLRSNLNLSVLKNDEKNLIDSMRKGRALTVSSVRPPAPLSHLRQLVVRGLSRRAEARGAASGQEYFAKWHINQMQLWLLEERPDQEEAQVRGKVRELVAGIRNYLADPEHLRRDREKLKIYLSALDELCLILEREQDKQNPREFFWNLQQQQRLFDLRELDHLVRQSLPGRVDGLNEQSKAVRLLIVLVSELTFGDPTPVEALRLLLDAGPSQTVRQSQISLSRSLEFIRLLNLVWWNRQLRTEVGLSLKFQVKSRQVFRATKDAPQGLGKRGAVDDSGAAKDAKKGLKKMWRKTQVDCDSEVFVKVMFAFCLEKLKNCKNWFEYYEWNSFYLKVRLTALSSQFRKLALMLYKITPEFKKELPLKSEKQFQQKLFALFAKISKVFKKICQLLNELISKKTQGQSVRTSTLELLLKTKKNIIQKSSRLSRNFVQNVSSKESVIVPELGHLIEAEKIFPTCIAILNSSNFKQGYFYQKFLNRFHQLISSIAASKGGIPLLFRNPDLASGIEEVLSRTHTVSLDRASGLFSSLDLQDTSFNIYSRLLSDPFKVMETPSEKELINCQHHLFFRSLNDSVTFLISLYGSIYVMSKQTDLIHTFIALKQFLKSEPMHKQAFSLILKEQLVMKLFLTILFIENEPNLLQRMHREVLLCLQILADLFSLATSTFYIHHQEITKTLKTLRGSVGLARNLLSPPNLINLESAIADLESKLKPLGLLNQDLPRFVSFLKEQSRYTQNNIQTLLSNKNIRFDDEREFPEDDLSKRLARLRDDFLPFFGLGQGKAVQASLANISLLEHILTLNSTSMHKLVDNDCFSPIVMLIQISTYVLKALLEQTDFSCRLVELLDQGFTRIVHPFFSILNQATDIALFKLTFKLQQESYSKEYENLSLFRSFLSIIKLIADFFPSLVSELIENSLLESEDWQKDRLFPVRKNSYFSEVDSQTNRLLKFLITQSSDFFNLGVSNKMYGHKSSRKKSWQLHWKKTTKSSFILPKTKALLLKLAPKLIKFVRLWSYFSGSFDVLMNELLFQLFELPRHKALTLALISLFIRQPLFLDQRTKHRKITETLLLEKVRVLKKSSLVVFFKHGSNPSDSLLELNVIKNNRTTVLGHLLFNFLPRADSDMLWGISCLLRSLLSYREEGIFENLHKNLDAMADQLKFGFEKVHLGEDSLSGDALIKHATCFSLLFLDLLEDSGFKEYLLEHYIVEKLGDTLLTNLYLLKDKIVPQKFEAQATKLTTLLAEILAKSLDPFKGFDYPNSKVPKKFNGDHMLLRKHGLVGKCRKAISLALKLLKEGKSKDQSQFLPWLKIIESLTGTQTGRFLLVFGEDSKVIGTERMFSIKRKMANKLKEILGKVKAEGFSKINYKFGSIVKHVVQNLEKCLTLGVDKIDKEDLDFVCILGKIWLNLIQGDDHEIKGLSALRVFFIEKSFIKKQTLWEFSKFIFEIIGKLKRHPLDNTPQQISNDASKLLNQAYLTFQELNKFLQNYIPFDSSQVGLRKLFKKKSKHQDSYKSRDYSRKEDEKFKLKLQKYNQILQRVYSGKFNYEDDNIVPFISDLEFFQLHSRPMGKPAFILGHMRLPRYISPKLRSLEALSGTSPLQIQIPKLLLCVANPIFYNLFSIKRSNFSIEQQEPLKAGRRFEGDSLSKFETWFKKGVSKLCELVFESDRTSGKKLAYRPSRRKRLIEGPRDLSPAEFELIYLTLEDYKLFRVENQEAGLEDSSGLHPNANMKIEGAAEEDSRNLISLDTFNIGNNNNGQNHEIKIESNPIAKLQSLNIPSKEQTDFVYPGVAQNVRNHPEELNVTFGADTPTFGNRTIASESHALEGLRNVLGLDNATLVQPKQNKTQKKKLNQLINLLKKKQTKK